MKSHAPSSPAGGGPAVRRRRLLRIAIGMALSCAACASARSHADDRAAVLALYDEYNSVFVSRDFALLERLALGDLLHVTASGHVQGIAELEKGLSEPAVRVQSVTSDNHQVRLAGDTAVVVGRVHGVGTREGKPFDSVWRVTVVFARREGRWRVQSTHASNLRDRNEQ